MELLALSKRESLIVDEPVIPVDSTSKDLTIEATVSLSRRHWITLVRGTSQWTSDEDTVTLLVGRKLRLVTCNSKQSVWVHSLVWGHRCEFRSCMSSGSLLEKLFARNRFRESHLWTRKGEARRSLSLRNSPFCRTNSAILVFVRWWCTDTDSTNYCTTKATKSLFVSVYTKTVCDLPEWWSWTLKNRWRRQNLLSRFFLFVLTEILHVILSQTIIAVYTHPNIPIPRHVSHQEQYAI